MSCGKPVDLSWVDVESLLVFVAVVKDTPKCDDWMFSDLKANVNKFIERNKKIFWQFNAKSYTQDKEFDFMYEYCCYSNSFKKYFRCFNKWKNSLTVFLNLSIMQLLGQHGNIRLLWTILLQRKFRVKAAYITGYETFVKHFSEFLWEIDPHYLKIKKKGMPFLETVEKNFLGFNDPLKHKHAVKNLCS